MRKLFLVALVMTSFKVTTAQIPIQREIAAKRTSLPIKIDGELLEEAWKGAPAVNTFVDQRPSFGITEKENSKTEMFILVDDNAVYISGICREISKDSVATELVRRDSVGVNDFAGVMFDTYQDKINGVGFYVTALGE